MAEHVAACFVVDGTHVVARTRDQGVHFGEAIDLVRTEVEPGDDALSIDARDLRVKAALRALVTDFGVLPCRGDAPVDVAAVLAETDRGVPLAAALRARGIELAYERARVVGRFDAHGDVLEGACHVVVVHLARAQLHGAFEHLLESREALERAWYRGRVLPTPELAMALRGLAQTTSTELRSRAWEVTPGLRMLPVRTPTLPPATHTNAFLVGSGELALVEPASPYPEEIDALVAEVETARASGQKLVAILVTHHHPDHVGGAVALRDRLGVPLLAHPATAQRLEGRVRFDRLIGDGERLALDGSSPMELVAVHTPGHAPGHLCFLESRSRALIAGDMVAGVGTILVETTDGDMSLYLDSLRDMRALDPTMLLPAHGGVVRDPGRLLDHYVAHRLARESKVLDALAQARSGSVASLVPVAYDDAPRSVWPLAVLSVEAHLAKLVREGRARRNGDTYAIV